MPTHNATSPVETITAEKERSWLNRLRFPRELESAFQRDYYERSRNTIRSSSALAALLMVPSAIYNHSIGVRPATIMDGAFAVVALLLCAAVSHPQGGRVWKPLTFIAAIGAGMALAVRNAVWMPRLPTVGSVNQAEALILLSHLLFLVYAFVIGRFTFRWFLTFVTLDLAAGVGAIALWFRPVLAPLAWQSTGSLLPAAAMLGMLAYRQERGARAEFLANYLLNAERNRAEALLLNVLPASVAARLKERPESIADNFDEAGILFADIVQFTPLAANVPASEVVRLLNDIFTVFDALADQHGMEKIKTIGDAYMAAVGLPEPRENHALALAQMALGMRAAAAAFRRPDNGLPVEIRIGIHTGPVVAGVIGTRKFIYDLWGDTVNIASRLESHGKPGAIQCTDAAHRLLQDHFAFDGPAPLALKGRGEMPVYLLLGPLDRT